MKTMIVFGLVLVAGLALARPGDIIDIEQDNMEHEQDGIAGVSVNGEYSWIAPDGTEHKTKYIADHLGYRIIVDDVPELRAVEVDDDEDDDEPEVRTADEDEDEEKPEVRTADEDDEEDDD